jgi:uncharacterized protein DUF4236
MRNSFRFFKRFKNAPGLWLNFSRNGVSASAGVRGAHVSVGRRGIRTSETLPGTGLFMSQQWRGHRRNISITRPSGLSLWATLALTGAIAFFANRTVGLIFLGLALVLLVASFFSRHSAPVESRENAAELGARIQALSEAAIPLAREVDQTNSPEAIDRLSKVVDECLTLALRTGNADMIAAAQRAFDHVGSRSIAPELDRLLQKPLRGC